MYVQSIRGCYKGKSMLFGVWRRGADTQLRRCMYIARLCQHTASNDETYGQSMAHTDSKSSVHKGRKATSWINSWHDHVAETISKVNSTQYDAFKPFLLSSAWIANTQSPPS